MNNNETDLQRWMRFAREELQSAVRALDRKDEPPRLICVLAQQASEKAIKAVLLSLNVDFPYSHNLDTLWNLIPVDWMAKPKPDELEFLTEIAGESRYPGDSDEPSYEDAEHAVALAQTVVDQIEANLARHTTTIEEDE